MESVWRVDGGINCVQDLQGSSATWTVDSVVADTARGHVPKGDVGVGTRKRVRIGVCGGGKRDECVEICSTTDPFLYGVNVMTTG